VNTHSSTFKRLFEAQEVESLHHDYFSWLRREKNVLDLLEELWTDNFRQFGFKHLAVDVFKKIREGEFRETNNLIADIDNVFTDPDFKKFTRFSRQANNSKMDLNYQLVREHLQGVESFFDYGCGRMALIRRIVRENTSIRRFYGYDPKSQPYYLDFDPRVAFFDHLSALSHIPLVDVVYSSFVFHHLTEEQIEQSLHCISNILKPGGKFILVEETFPEREALAVVDRTGEHIEQFGYEAHTDLLQIFLQLSEREKMLVIYLNDVLINLKNLSYMPWTFEYRTIEQWSHEVEKHGFKKSYDDLFWILKEGKIKQGVSGMMVFEKN
jgi:SAM-dependent methyltransferase